MTYDVLDRYNHLLVNISKELDIPPSKYQKAVERYSAVGNWLKEGEYEGSEEEPHIYPQGSFRIGTVVRPLREGKEADYDIDLVCQFRLPKGSTIPEKVKSIVGDRLKENENYRRMLDDEGRRCWTLNYAEEDGIGFHVDVLPSAPENGELISVLVSAGVPEEMASLAIAITHKDERYSYSWSPSNPNGYAEWFLNVNRPVFERIKNVEKKYLLENNRTLYAKVDDVPDPLVKTPLQRAIQILKRHRDSRFAGHELEDDKPISMIITTLSAHLYQNEGDVYTTIRNIIEKLNAHASLLQPGYSLNENIASLRLIEKKSDGTWYIPNPVNPAENFADRWHENNNRKAYAFFKWVSWVSTDLLNIINEANINNIGNLLEQHFGEGIISKASSGLYVTAGPTVISRTHKEAPNVEIKNPIKPWSNIG